MFSTLVNAWKVKDIRTKILYVLLILAIYRIGCHIPLPGIDGSRLLEYQKENTATDLLTLIAGGGFGSIFAMGIGPYINSSIIMQLLCVAIPALERMQKEGEEGRKKINQITRYLAVGLAFLQGSFTVYGFRGLFMHDNLLTYLTSLLAIVTGTIFIMWISELLTEKAVGNGSSFIIFSNILSGIPTGIAQFHSYAQGGFWEIGKVVVVLLVFVVIIAFVVLIQDGERRIPVQYSKKNVGGRIMGGQSSFIPIKVNIAGVMSIIFAISLLQFPKNIYQLWKADWLKSVVDVLEMHNVIGAAIYVFLIFCFTFFYTSFSINPVDMAENLKKNGGMIPGVRPGKPTSDFVSHTIGRLSWIGGFAYAIVAMIPVAMTWIFKIDVGIGGTTVLIVVGVALELTKQLESQLLMRHYKGFLKS